MLTHTGKVNDMEALERYQEAVNATTDRRAFDSYFIGTLSAKFDGKLDEREWDDALAKALAYSHRTDQAAA